MKLVSHIPYGTGKPYLSISSSFRINLYILLLQHAPVALVLGGRAQKKKRLGGKGRGGMIVASGLCAMTNIINYRFVGKGSGMCLIRKGLPHLFMTKEKIMYL